jgi:DNA adenine methylase
MKAIITEDELDSAKPFLRWAGGKTWFVNHLKQEKKQFHFNNYFEPFLGGGAVFFFLNPQKLSFLSDLNADLIETYRSIKENPLEVILCLKEFTNTEEDYYRIRASSYDTPSKRAAKFIYLNQTSYNGIYRVNLKGEYNVPFGHRKKLFLDENTLLQASKALKNVTLNTRDFYESINDIRPNDLIFLDPPYTVSHNDNGFIKYNEKIFSLEDQIRLSHFIDEIKAKGAYYILTNAAHIEVKKIFNKGDKILELKRASLVGGKNAAREKYSEFIFTNVL